MLGYCNSTSKQVSVYADDDVLVTRTKQALVNTLQKLKKEAGNYGLTINQNKTKYMRLLRTQTHRKDIETEEMKFEEVSRVKYLGTIVTKNNFKPMVPCITIQCQ